MCDNKSSLIRNASSQAATSMKGIFYGLKIRKVLLKKMRLGRGYSMHGIECWESQGVDVVDLVVGIPILNAHRECVGYFQTST